MAAKKPPKLPPIPPGWKGGFAESNKKFAYPKPNLSSLPMMCNLAHIPLLKRQQNVRWPEFSWQTIPGKEKSRCFQMFAPFISRLGYTDTGRVYSIICPQQGVWIFDEICLNVEVTVTGVRGWANEKSSKAGKDYAGLAADMTVQPKVWLTPKGYQGPIIKAAWDYFQLKHPEFPLSKEHAILINTYDPGNPDQPIFPLRRGETTTFKSPEFARHDKDRGYYAVGNLGVEIGDIEPKHNHLVDDFNHLLMDAFNLGSGNMLTPGNVLTWNVWFTEPQLVNTQEWKDHAEKWRKSIDAHHGPPYTKEEKEEWPGLLDARPMRYANGKEFVPPLEKDLEELKKIVKEIYDWIKKNIF